MTASSVLVHLCWLIVGCSARPAHIQKQLRTCQWIGLRNAADDHESGHVFRTPVGTQRRNPVYLWLWDLHSDNLQESLRWLPPSPNHAEVVPRFQAHHWFRQPLAIYVAQEWLSTYQLVLPTSIHVHQRFEDNRHMFLALVMRHVMVVFKLSMLCEC